MVINPSVAFPTDRNPEGFIKQEHASPALVMVALGRRYALAQQEQIDPTASVLGKPKPLLDPDLVKTLLLGPLRRAAGNRASALVLS